MFVLLAFNANALLFQAASVMLGPGPVCRSCSHICWASTCTALLLLLLPAPGVRKQHLYCCIARCVNLQEEAH